MNKKLLLIPVMLLVFSISANAISQSLYDKAVLIVPPHGSVTLDTSNSGRTGTNVGIEIIDTAVFGQNSSMFYDTDGNDRLLFDNDDDFFTTMQNQTFSILVNNSAMFVANDMYMSRKESTVEGEMYIFQVSGGEVFCKYLTGGGPVDISASVTGAIEGVDGWKMITCVLNQTSGIASIQLYINDTLVDSATGGATSTVASNIAIGWDEGIGQEYTSGMICPMVFNASLTGTEVTELWESITVDNEDCGVVGGAPPPPSGFTITVKDFHNDSGINSFTAILTNATETYTNSTTTGSINFENITQGIYSITIQSTEAGGYFDRTFEDVNASSDFEVKIWQAIVYINASDIVDGLQILNFGALSETQLNISNSTGFATLRLNAKSHNIIGNASIFFPSNQNLSLSPLEEKFFTLEFGRNLLSINATDIFSNQSISSFTINTVGINLTYDRTSSTTTGQINFSISPGNYTVIFSSATHAITSVNVTVDKLITNLTLQPYPINSIFIRVFQEGTTNPINFQEVTADFDSDDQVLNLSTGNGTILAESLFPGLYTITMGSDGYNSRQYILNLLASSNVQLNTFLINDTNTAEITFTIKDASTLTNLDNVLVSVSDKINLTYITIAQKTTDISGQVIFNLDQTNKYRFTLSRNDFETKTFDLTPSSTSYTINIDPTALIDYTTIYNTIDLLTIPISNYITGLGILNFSIITASVAGSVINFFGVNTTFNDVEYKTNVSGSAAGGTATIEVDLNQSFTSIGITFFVDVDGNIPFIIDRKFYITNITAGNNSLVSAVEQLGDEVPQVYLTIIGTFIVLLIVATVASLGLRDRRLNVVAGSTMGILSLPGLTMFNPLISVPIIIILFAAYFIGGNRADD